MAKSSPVMTGGNSSNLSKLFLAGLVFHLVFIASVFDCYFTSPVVHGMKSFSLDNAQSKRLVLIVGDGLRADLLFTPNGFSFSDNSPQVVAPHLRSIIENRGAYGVSHTRVPTESRPGHVAIIAGMYEDVSAVTKGWKTNPVDFDSVFNQSSHTFSFGSPDILPMFARGASPGKVDMWCYNEEDEDFTKDATALDFWVLDKLRELFHNATADEALESQLRSDRVIFFLHLLGLDTTGHSYRPHSKEYMNNIRVVDSIVTETEKLFDEFYRDSETSYIFTADHGMSQIGNHGDGDPDNTRTPFVAWGKGVRAPLPDSVHTSHDEYSQPWKLGHLLRRDMQQADLAPLMASLVGIPWPVNSVGVLPDVSSSLPGFLLPEDGEGWVARAALVNAQVILEQYRIKHELKNARALFYKPFALLENVNDQGLPMRARRISKIERLLDEKSWHKAREESADLIKDTLHGLRYLETYDRLLIRAIVIAAYLGWAAYASLSIFQLDNIAAVSSTKLALDLVASVILFASWTSFFLQKSPWTFYLYIAFPCYFWHQFFSGAIPALRTYLHSAPRKRISFVALFFHGALVIAALQCMVAAYMQRYIWSVGFVLMGVIWPFYWPRKMWYSRRWLCLCWALACLIAGIFPLLSVNKTESIQTILLGGGSMLLTGVMFVFSMIRAEQWNIASSMAVQLGLILTSMIVTATSAASLQAKQGLPLLNQVFGWLILVTASVMPFVSKIQHATPNSKLMALFLGFGVCFIILSISVEGLFYFAYSVNLALWVEVEATLRSEKNTPLRTKTDNSIYHFQADDLRIAIFFLFFVQVAFFGTGNVASISSFYLEPVYRLVPIFNPFLMAALLIFKIVAPYVILSAMFATLNSRLHLPPFSLFVVALTLTDGMTMTFFLNVTDEGSWLEIGQSISFFCITSLLLVWSAGICVAGEYLMADTLKLMQVNSKTE